VLPKPAHPSRPHTSLADSCSVLLGYEEQDSAHRFYVFGNHTASSQPDYKTAISAILASNFSKVVKFSTLPEPAASVADALFRDAQYQQFYSTNCWQYSLRGSPPAHVRSTWQQLVDTLPPGYTLGPLLPQDAELVNDTWKFR
jgi:hypothetical protein